MPLVTSIYGLYDPTFPSLIMYVGKGLSARASSHWKSFIREGKSVNAKLYHWFKSIKAAGSIPEWRFLEENVTDWQDAEIKWIAYWRKHNPGLCNILAGGNQWPIESNRLGGLNQSREDKIRAGRSGGAVGGCRVHELYPGMAKKNGDNNSKFIHEHYPDLAKKAGVIGCHNRWHVKRNQPNPKCQLCRLDFFDIWESQNAA